MKATSLRTNFLARTRLGCVAGVVCACTVGATMAADPVPALGSPKSLMVRSESLSMPEVLTSRSLTTPTTSIQSVVISDVVMSNEPLLLPVRSFKDAPNACKSDSISLCYDYRTGKAIFKPTRELLPTIPGLKAEGLSAKRDRLTFLYSFK